MILSSKNTITSVELVEQINVFRSNIEGKVELMHKNILTIIRDEFEEEISVAKISATEYLYKGKKYPMFNLTLSQAKQVLIRESKVVRKAVIKYIEELEEKGSVMGVIHTMNADQLEVLTTVTRDKENVERLVAIQAPKVEYYDEVMKSSSTYTVTQIAKELGLRSAVNLNQKLVDRGVQFKQSGQWQLYSQYTGKGYTDTKTTTYRHTDGTTGSTMSTRWTEKGRVFIHSLVIPVSNPLLNPALN